MKSDIIYEGNGHKCVIIRDGQEQKTELVDTNEFLVIDEAQGLLIDPGGMEIYPNVLAELTKYIEIDKLKVLFISHQDPDVSSSLALWFDLCPSLKVYCPEVWADFISHFGMGSVFDIISIPDEGLEIQVGSANSFVYIVPAHYCHSSANFSVFDPKANILFSGDIGTSQVPGADRELFVSDFERHIQFMEQSHRRLMPSSDALKKWVKRARAINPGIIAPQHGSIFNGGNVKKLLDWLENLEVTQVDTAQEDVDMTQCVWMKWR